MNLAKAVKFIKRLGISGELGKDARTISFFLVNVLSFSEANLFSYLWSCDSDGRQRVQWRLAPLHIPIPHPFSITFRGSSGYDSWCFEKTVSTF